jgi:hypothetical protein
MLACLAQALSYVVPFRLLRGSLSFTVAKSTIVLRGRVEWNHLLLPLLPHGKLQFVTGKYVGPAITVNFAA